MDPADLPPHYQDVDIATLSAAAEAGQVTWSDEQKAQMDMRLAKARLRYRQTQMKARRGGHGRYEVIKRRTELKGKVTATVNPKTPRAVAVPTKAKVKQTQKAQKQVKKRQAAAKASALEAGQTVSVKTETGEVVEVTLEDKEVDASAAATGGSSDLENLMAEMVK